MRVPCSLLAVALAGVSVPALAQPAYPVKTIRILVAYTPAGTTDILARALGQKFTEVWSQPVIVENRPGAGGNIGTEVAAKAPPDGYTLLMGTAGTHGVNPTLYAKIGFDAVRDFAPVSVVALVPNVLVVNPALPVKSVKELVALSKQRPGQIAYGSPGIGSTGHMSTELFKTLSGLDASHVPYKGSSPLSVDLIGGQIAMSIDNLPPYVQHVKGGKLRALAVTPVKRSSVLPDVPTMAEAGVTGYDAASWFALFAPAGTARDIVDKVSNETARILKLPDIARRLADLGAESVGSTPEQTGEFVRAEIAKWAKVIKASGAKAE